MSSKRLRIKQRLGKISKQFLIQIHCDFHLVFLVFTKKNIIGFPRKAEDKGSKGSLSGRIYSSVILQGDIEGGPGEDTKGLILFQD